MKNLHRWVLPLLLILGSGACFGQSTNAGDIRGTVTDPSGALIPGVTVSVLNVDTGVSKDFVTNQDGLYDTSSIVAGNYRITFSKDGFEKLVRGPITLQVGFTSVNAELKVGAMSQEVTVSTDVPLLKTETSEQSTTLEARSMEQLPQVAGGSGVSWENFMILLPGATGTPGSSQGSSNPGQEVAINGNLPYSNILADGASTTLSHSQNANPAVFETVSELQVNTSSFSAQYGIGGAIFNQITKSGTNQFHGAAYEYFQNDALTAHSQFQTGPMPHLRFNNFGFAVGGPILKKKMFFFFDYDQIVDHGNSSGTSNVPTPGMMSGNFDQMNLLYDPTTQIIKTDSAGNPYPVRKSFLSETGSNSIPSSLFDKVAANMQGFFPTPSSHIAGGIFVPGTLGSEGQPQNNFFASILQSTPYRKYFGRLDYDITSTNRVTLSDTQSDTPVIYPSTVFACPITCQSGDVDNNNAQITDVWNISPRTINEARMGFTSQLNFFQDLALNKGYASKLGWQFGKADDFPAIITPNWQYPFAWINPGSNSVYKEFTWDPSDVVTMIRGKHILHFGGELLAYQNNSTAWGNTNAGQFTFSGQYTQQWTVDANGVASPQAGTGMEYADFLLGYAQSWNASISPEYGARMKTPQIFVQDDWKLRPNLTINLGLRYQINHGWNEVKNNMSSFDPTILNPATNTPGAYWFGTTHTNGRTSLQANTFNTWQPRVGFAWAYDPKTTFRGGFGLYSYTWSLDTYGGNNTSYGMGAAISASGSATDQSHGVTPVTKLDGTGTLFGTSTMLPYTAGSTAPDAHNNQGVGYIQYHTPVPRIMQWNVSVQRALTTDTVVELAYVASHGSNLNFPTDLNQVPQSKWSSNDSAFRPYPIFQGISGSTNNAISNYNSLQASITRRMTHGVSLSFNYVWSHMLDDQDSSGWGSHSGAQDFQNAFNPAANYSNSNFDVRHAFKGYAVYELPFGRGKQFLNGNRLLDEAVGGWQIAGTVILQTGNPFTVYGNQANYSLAGVTFPNWNPGVNWRPSGGSNRNEWFNPAAFLQPAPGTWGNVRRNSLYGPGINVFNLEAAKSFLIPWKEGVSIQFRADAQNVFNHPSFGPPSGTNLGNTSSAGGVGLPYDNATPLSTTTVSGRNLQLALRVSF
ncbi:MAG TPA: TonB-dependent receptor [Candidatus Sulfotelmatobacter sp.]|nr:TonB-dependent receptor [Candidatus Sulfotelmatobacter sp.]